MLLRLNKLGAEHKILNAWEKELLAWESQRRNVILKKHVMYEEMRTNWDPGDQIKDDVMRETCDSYVGGG